MASQQAALAGAPSTCTSGSRTLAASDASTGAALPLLEAVARGSVVVGTPRAAEASCTGSSASGEGSDGNDVSSTLYFGNLHPYVQQRSLEDLCSYFGQVDSAKVIKDKATGASAGYGFVKFADKKAAEAALQALNGQSYLGEELRVNWALPNNHKEDTSYHYHIFVGDLGSDVTDAVLYNTFCTIGQCSDARVMWDHNTGRSKGYGFVSFRRKEDAENAIEVMQARQIGSRRIRVGWAQHKQEENVTPLDYSAVDKADPANTNIYIGNISPETTEATLTAHFSVYGPVAEVKLHKKGGYGFVKFEHHKSAVKAIIGQHGKELDGRVPKCSWGKNISSSRNANIATNSALSLAAALQNTHLASSAGQGPVPVLAANAQSVMVSLAAAAAANAVATVTAAHGAGGPSVGSYGPAAGLEAQRLGPGYASGPAPMSYLPGASNGLPHGFMGLHHHQGARQMASGPQGPSTNMLAGGLGMFGNGQLMYNQPGMSHHQVAPSHMALATQMMMMQGLQAPQDALTLQATMAALNPAAMAALNSTAITAGNMSLDPLGSMFQGGAYGGLYGLGGQHVHML